MIENIKMMDCFKFSFSPKKYRWLLKNSLMKAILYLGLMATIFGIFQGITAVTILTTVEKSTQIAFKDEKFKFEMKNGILDFKATTYKEEQGKILLLVDSSKTINEVDSLRYMTVHKEMSTVFLKDGFMIKMGADQIIYKYSDLGIEKLNFTNETIVNIVNKMHILKYLMIPFLIIFKFIDMFLYVILISVTGLLSILLNRQKLAYKNIFKLAIYAITLPTVISLIFPLGRATVIVGGTLLILGLNSLNYSEVK